MKKSELRKLIKEEILKEYKVSDELMEDAEEISGYISDEWDKFVKNVNYKIKLYVSKNKINREDKAELSDTIEQAMEQVVDNSDIKI